MNGREYQTEFGYETDELAQENAAMRAFMVCRNFAVNGGMLSRNGVIQGLPVSSSDRERRRPRRRSRGSMHSSRGSSVDSDEASTRSKPDAGAISGGTDSHRPWRKSTTLSVNIAERPVLAIPDTGSDDNAVSAVFAKELGLQIDAGGNHLASFQLANGREVKSSGVASTTCTF